jgi:glucuronokinase
MSIEGRAYARAGLLGNPSDGYYGKIVAVSIKDFASCVHLTPQENLEIVVPAQDTAVFADIQSVVEQVDLFGYYGGVRLVKAAIVQFVRYCRDHSISLENKNFKLEYDSGIPRQLGLGGSSAIITAAFRALLDFYEVEIPQEVLPTLVLDAELKELGINAGFMDRVIQVYEGCVYMDLDERLIAEKGFGSYERLDPALLPPLYLAYKPVLGKVSGRVLNDIRQGYDRGDPNVIGTLERIAELAEIGRDLILRRDYEQLPLLMDENFDLRSRIMRISDENRELIQTARRCGASAKFAGSGGSIVGMYRDEDMYLDLVVSLEKLGAKVLKPRIV